MQARKGKRLVKGCCVLILLLPLLSGCWDSLPVDKRATILGLAIDQASPNAGENSNITGAGEAFVEPKKKLIRLTAQVAVPGRLPLGPGGMGGDGGGQKQKPVWVVSVVGHTIDDAMMNLQQQLSDKIFLGHLRVIVVSDKIAKRGLRQISDFLRRDSEIRRTAWLLVAKDAARIMNVAPPLETIPTLYLTSAMTEAVDMGKLPSSFLGVFWRISSSEGTNPFLPYVTVKGSDNIEIAGLAYFKKDKMVGRINPFEIGLFMGIKGLNPGGYAGFVPVPARHGAVLLQSRKRQSKITINIDHGQPRATVKIHLEVILKEKSNPRMVIHRTKDLDEIEKINNHQLDIAYRKLIAKTQKKGSDIFGFGEYVRAKHPRYWNSQIRTLEKWDRVYKHMPVDVDAVVKIRRVGVKAK